MLQRPTQQVDTEGFCPKEARQTLRSWSPFIGFKL